MGGGFTGTQYLADVWESQDDGSTWTQVLMTAPWAPRYCHAALLVPSRDLGSRSSSCTNILVLGGHAGLRSVGDVWESPDWEEVQRHRFALLLVGRRLEALFGLSLATWRDGVVPYLLPC